MSSGQISNPLIYVKPSPKLREYISKVKINEDLPTGIANIVFKNKVKERSADKPTDATYLLTEDDRSFIRSLKLEGVEQVKIPTISETNVLKNDKLISLRDIQWLFEYMQRDGGEKVYFHELFTGSEVVLPENPEIPRNAELEKRCVKLRANQANAFYHTITKNVDTVRRRHPEDTIAFQVKQMNRQLIAVFQFIISVLAGFAFGFIGVELLIGNLDFGFRLLLGIICALTIALAELYFLAKRLNEDLKFETAMEKKKQSGKLD